MYLTHTPPTKAPSGFTAFVRHVHVPNPSGYASNCSRQFDLRNNRDVGELAPKTGRSNNLHSDLLFLAILVALNGGRNTSLERQ